MKGGEVDPARTTVEAPRSTNQPPTVIPEMRSTPSRRFLQRFRHHTRINTILRIKTMRMWTSSIVWGCRVWHKRRYRASSGRFRGPTGSPRSPWSISATRI